MEELGQFLRIGFKYAWYLPILAPIDSIEKPQKTRED